MKYKLTLKPGEYETLLDMMVLVVPRRKEPLPVEQKVILCLMQSLYARLHTKSLFRKKEYNISVPIAEALAFQAFWTGKPMRSIISSALINRIIGEIDQKTTSIIF